MTVSTYCENFLNKKKIFQGGTTKNKRIFPATYRIRIGKMDKHPLEGMFIMLVIRYQLVEANLMNI